MDLNFKDSEDEENLLYFLIWYNFQSWNFIFESQKGSDSDVIIWMILTSLRS